MHNDLIKNGQQYFDKYIYHATCDVNTYCYNDGGMNKIPE